MSIKAVAWAIDLDAEIDVYQWAVLVALADASNPHNDDCAWPSVATMSQRTRMSDRKVISCLDELEQLGLIVDTQRRAGRTKQVKIYRLAMSKGEQCAPLKTARCADGTVSTKPEDVVTNVTTRKKRGLAEVPLPDALKTPEFKAALNDWIKHRREIGKPVSAVSLKEQYASCEQMGVQEAISAIRHSIANGYVGIFPAKTSVYLSAPKAKKPMSESLRLCIEESEKRSRERLERIKEGSVE